MGKGQAAGGQISLEKEGRGAVWFWQLEASRLCNGPTAVRALKKKTCVLEKKVEKKKQWLGHQRARLMGGKKEAGWLRLRGQHKL